MSRSARLLPVGLLLAATALLAAPPVALAFDKVDRLQPVPAGRGYVYFIREADALKAPLAGRTVTILVGKVPAPDATVAPADASGHAVGPAEATATQQSGEDGRVYFLLHTSQTPGENEFTWKDPQYGGQVLVTGLGASPSASATAKGGAAGAAGGASSGHPGTPAVSGKTSSRFSPPPIAVASFAAALTWVAAAIPLRRRFAAAAAAAEEVPSLAARLPAITAPPR